MSMPSAREGALVLYKSQPAKVVSVADKIELSLADGSSKKVRPKDFVVLHEGPFSSFSDLDATIGDVEEEWELLQGESPSFSELAEIVLGEFTPKTAWQTWQLLQAGLHFSGDTESVQINTPAYVAEQLEQRHAAEAEKAAHEAFLQRVEQGAIAEEDRPRLAEVERVALGVNENSALLKLFNVDASKESAHTFLIRCGYWHAEYNPWPQRNGLDWDELEIGVPDLPDESRVDMTDIEAWAIDDEGSKDPDDAISLVDGKLWVHIADVASLVRVDGHLDLAARERGANLYLPEGVKTMLPWKLTEQLGLGLQPISPALSIGFRVNDGQVEDVEICLSSIKVARDSYSAVNERMDQEPFVSIAAMTMAFRERRHANDAARLDLPERSVRLIDGEVVLKPLESLASRDMVTDAMLMAGEAVSLFAEQNDIAIPYVVQPQPEELRDPQTLSEMCAYRRLFKPSQTALQPGRHFGLGLDRYTRATSPLRRYSDLLVHQQIRAFLTDKPTLTGDQVAERLAGVDSVSGKVRRTERQSNLHWKLVMLQRLGDWQGEAIVVALEERKVVVLIPELAMEVKVRRQEEMTLDQSVTLKAREIDLTTQEAFFQVLSLN